MKNSKILWITRTAVLLALLIALQWATAGTQVFAGQYITGSCVNAVLAVAVLFSGVWSGVTIALLSPFFAKALGIGPQLIQIVPAIAAGNLVDCFLGIMAVVLQGAMKSIGLSPQWQCGILAATSAAVALFIYRNTRSLT